MDYADNLTAVATDSAAELAALILTGLAAGPIAFCVIVKYRQTRLPLLRAAQKLGKPAFEDEIIDAANLDLDPMSREFYWIMGELCRHGSLRKTSTQRGSKFLHNQYEITKLGKQEICRLEQPLRKRRCRKSPVNNLELQVLCALSLFSDFEPAGNVSRVYRPSSGGYSPGHEILKLLRSLQHKGMLETQAREHLWHQKWDCREYKISVLGLRLLDDFDLL